MKAHADMYDTYKYVNKLIYDSPCVFSHMLRNPSAPTQPAQPATQTRRLVSPKAPERTDGRKTLHN